MDNQLKISRDLPAYKKREVKARVMEARKSRTMKEDFRKSRRNGRRLLKAKDAVISNWDKPGRFISSLTSSRDFICAYRFAMYEHDFNQRAMEYDEWDLTFPPEV